VGRVLAQYGVGPGYAQSGCGSRHVDPPDFSGTPTTSNRSKIITAAIGPDVESSPLAYPF
jgi:hypothetical protein